MDYLHTLKKTLQGRFIIVVIVAASLYIAFSVYAVNRTIVEDTLTGSYPIGYKTTLIKSILIGSWGMFPPLEALLLIVTAMLLGINIALVGKTITRLQGSKGLRVSFGGSSVLAIASAGCPACGISLLSLLGISVPLLPVQGIPLQLIAITLLVGSIIYSLRKLQQPIACTVPLKKH